MSVSSTFEWKVSPNLWKTMQQSQYLDKFESPLHSAFNCEFCMRLYPFGGESYESTICLYLVCETFPANIHAITVRRILHGDHLAHRHRSQKTLARRKETTGWISAKLASDRLLEMSKERFVCKMEVLQIYSTENPTQAVPRNEWKKFIGCSNINNGVRAATNTKMNAISNHHNRNRNRNRNRNSNRVNNAIDSNSTQSAMQLNKHLLSLVTHLDDRMKQMESILNDVQRTVAKHEQLHRIAGAGVHNQASNESQSQSEHNSDWQSVTVGIVQVQHWLKSIGMIEYLNAFIDCGFDDLSIICELNDQVLMVDIGISKKGHRMKLLKAMQHRMENFITIPAATVTTTTANTNTNINMRVVAVATEPTTTQTQTETESSCDYSRHEQQH